MFWQIGQVDVGCGGGGENVFVWISDVDFRKIFDQGVCFVQVYCVDGRKVFFQFQVKIVE